MPNKIKPIIFDLEKAVFHIIPQYCKGCGLCKEKCPNDVLIWSDKLGVYGTPIVTPKDEDSCIACNICEQVCPDCAIVIKKKKKKKAII
ncbi:2-oxoglutarate/2-oxoacid ferredoxin oxidoreductase, delta subunit [Candidatus Syntrophocurvum alkaliphilum]|uniref:2-oxoglutarate/2-oxoacid ferredoxin oxidoreductase, delta subunit n=1 Tax=Candidatus Syntrophocurvum alkaliphilum TaxID=2293317 RepID=A0A6I6DIU8_9FIRM|nr:ferredoxin family protein [Candidatus Syntrophocurvum alkaliphilum]QGU00589.1 2-oxoglutarate/2-oxoacid ferredoxin oxidoreductase, delta subunit [Candidatus Syntrophocurvum alkaliphilum]